VFEPFFTTKPAAHSGLGMSTALGSVKKHDGAIQIQSAMGAGTTVMVYLPAADELTEIPSEDVPVPLDGRTVLLVEDEEIPRQLQAHVLQSAGFCVLAANDGLQGLELFEEYGKEIDLVVTDIVMPRMSGDALVGEIRKLNKPVKILAVSGYAGREAAARLRSLGVDAFVQKPFTGQSLLDQVRQVLAV
jgi:CheY-like chemotaxis protein